ncbi:MAG: hypothetical protein JKP92_00540 [Alphaproteobacteria bacterium]|nr:hypothetical protein [Alphaproteobacteria bacterium]
MKPFIDLQSLGTPGAMEAVCRNALRIGSPETYRVALANLNKPKGKSDQDITRQLFRDMLGERAEELGAPDPLTLWERETDIAEILRGSAAVMREQGIPMREVAEMVQDEYMGPLDDLIYAEDNPAIRAGLKGIRDEAMLALGEIEALAEAEEAWERAEAEQSAERRATGCADLREVGAQAMRVGALLSSERADQIICEPFGRAANPVAVCGALARANKGDAVSASTQGGAIVRTPSRAPLCVGGADFAERVATLQPQALGGP